MSSVPSSQLEDMMEIWRNHLCGVLNQPGNIVWSIVEAFVQHEGKHSLDYGPSLYEVWKALGQLRNGNAPGEYNIHTKFSIMEALL